MGQRDDSYPSDVIRASDISRYVYCRRAWWYDRQGISSINIEEIQQGVRQHRRHGVFVRVMAALAVIAVLLIITGVFMAGVYFLQLAAGG
ncbi:MAG: hypothetical protein JXB47_19255 [Anaerolineae bacterium]|nr:hypothetical protein [Anaerolineae bacterium]